MGLIVVSTRLPVSVIRAEDRIAIRRSSGGVANGLSDLFAGTPGFGEGAIPNGTGGVPLRWVGWPGGVVAPQERPALDKLFSAQSLVPVYLSPEDERLFYDGFSNSTLWPLCHHFAEAVKLETPAFERYRSVNERFAEAVAAIFQPNDRIWVHDYQLMLLPAVLRARLPYAAIGYFHHIPFPAEAFFETLPEGWREPLLRGPVGANVVGFHTNDYAAAFLRSLRRTLGLTPNIGEIVQPTHRCRVGVYPMGIDSARFRELARSPLTETERVSLRSVLGGEKTILSVDRLDYTKGVIHRLRAFALLLKRAPEWGERVNLALVVVPSRVGVGEYRATKRAIEQLVGEINGRFSTPTWTPIFYRYRHLNPYELSAIYRAGDVALITPLRDGMNLVAKEYVASRIDDPGVLILSGGAGAAHDLGGALSVDPLDIEGMVGALTTALTMDRAERESRHRVMAEQIRSYSVHEWGRDFLAALSADSVAGPIEGLLPVARALVPRLRRAGRRLIFLDYDGTLRPFEVDPNAARPDRELMALLERLTSSPGATVVIVSGRSRESLERWFGHLPVGLIAEHGGEIRGNDGKWSPPQEVPAQWKERIRPFLERCVIATPGSFIEEKRTGLVWHYRGAAGPGDPSKRADNKARELIDFLLTFLAYSNLRVIPASKAVEVQVAGLDKGSAARRFLEAGRYDFAAAFGDDFTDEDLFAALPVGSAAVRVGREPTRAGYRLRDAAEVRLLLADCVAAEVDGEDLDYFVPKSRSPASPSPGTI
ncbi:MAG: hypothetical protein RL417_1061 [Pseudomonadota bacterium]|jgi:trehalose 6-phosphate synthase/phosphatase